MYLGKRHAGELINAALHREVKELVANLHLESTNDSGVCHGFNNYGFTFGNLRLHGCLDFFQFRSTQFFSTDNLGINFTTFGLHKLGKRGRNFGQFAQAGISGHGHEQIAGNIANLVQSTNISSFGFTADQRISHEFRKLLGRFLGSLEAIQLTLDLVQFSCLGSRNVNGVGVTSVKSVQLDNRTMGIIGLGRERPRNSAVQTNTSAGTRSR
mmetsp:Transcript_27844/g.65124  ORF Transcript_27844/g.65124 Transcript_27844/m.65124 type:complete len:212 (+) Transcript_27844:74-709(+)